MELKQFNVTVRRFDPAAFYGRRGRRAARGQPDDEHAVSAAMPDAVAFTRKTEGDNVLPIAFACIAAAGR